MYSKRIAYALTAAMVFWACGSATLSPAELQAFVADADNGLTKGVEVNGTTVTVAYRPTDFWVYQQVGDKGAKPAVLDSLRRKYDTYLYFVASFSREGREALQANEGFDRYSELVQNLSFRMADYACLVTSARDTIPLGDFMLNRTHGLSSATEVLFVFSRRDLADEESVQVNLREFGMNLGLQTFEFQMQDLLQAPQISFSEQHQNI